MRMYALYERSRKVLALYIIVGAVTLAVACVSLNFSGNQYLVSNSITDFFCVQWAQLGGKKEKPWSFQIGIGCGVALSREK